MDRNRLQEVRQTDLTESRVNEEFVDWLKNKGPTYLLIVLVALLVMLFLIRYQNRQQQERIAAWQELRQAALPSALEDVARTYDGIDAIAHLARLQAADSLLASVQANYPLEADPETEPDVVIPPDKREENLNEADRLYQTVIDQDDQSLAMTLLVVNALNGRAAVAEALGNLGAARELYEQAAQRAEQHYPDLAARARSRIETVGEMEITGLFPTEQEVAPLVSDPPEGERVSIDPAFQQLLLTPIDGDG